LFNSITRRALAEGASNIHIEPRAKELVVRYRVDGVLKRGMSVPLRLKDSMISRFKIMGDLDISERRLPQDGRFTVKAGRDGLPVDVRVASLPSVRGEKIVLVHFPTYKTLGFTKRLAFRALIDGDTAVLLEVTLQF
jgi:type IV pilus assembly protein PilB